MSETKELSYREQKIADFQSEIKELRKDIEAKEASIKRWEKFTDEDIAEIQADKAEKKQSSKKASNKPAIPTLKFATPEEREKAKSAILKIYKTEGADLARGKVVETYNAGHSKKMDAQTASKIIKELTDAGNLQHNGKALSQSRCKFVKS